MVIEKVCLAMFMRRSTTNLFMFNLTHDICTDTLVGAYYFARKRINVSVKARKKTLASLTIS